MDRLLIGASIHDPAPGRALSRILQGDLEPRDFAPDKGADFLPQASERTSVAVTRKRRGR